MKRPQFLQPAIELSAAMVENSRALGLLGKAEVYIRFPRAENFDRGRGELFRENERRAQVYIQRPKLPPAKTFDTAETFFRSPGSSCQRHSRWTSCGTRRDPTVTMPGWRCNSFVRTRCSISLLLIGQHLHLVR